VAVLAAVTSQYLVWIKQPSFPNILNYPFYHTVIINK